MNETAIERPYITGPFEGVTEHNERHYEVIQEALNAPRPVTLRDITASDLIDEALQCNDLPCEIDECIDNLLRLGHNNDPLIGAMRHQLEARRTMASLFYLLP